MSVLLKVFLDAGYAAATDTAQYTAPTTAVIDKFTGTNVTGSAVTVSVNIVRSGENAATSNKIVTGRTVLPGECYSFPEIVGTVLAPGDYISTVAGTAAALVLRMSGRQVAQ